MKYVKFSESCDHMKHTIRNRIFFFLPTVTLGLLSLWLHKSMMDTYTDSKGLLIPGNLPGMLLWIIGGVFALWLLFRIRTIGGEGIYEDNFPPCLVSGLTAALGGALMLTVAHQMQNRELWRLILGYAAAGSMVIAGICRMVGKRPSCLLHGLVCLFFVSVLLDNYRYWNTDPQLQEYAYQLLGGVLLMLAAFHRACCDAGILQRKRLLVYGLGAAFCCLAALDTSIIPRFYLASALWALGSVCNVAQFPPDPEDSEPVEIPEAPETEAREA